MPTAADWNLLRAALLDGDPARAAWDAWRRAAPLDAVTPAAFRVLPALYYNLERLGVAAPELARLGGVARKAWVEAQLWDTHLAGVLGVLAEAGVPAIVRGGPALARHYLAGRRARPSDDHEILVPPDRAADALTGLQRVGWRVPLPPHFPARQWRGPVRCVTAGPQAYVDVIPHLAWEANDRAGDWLVEAEEATLGAVTARVLPPAAQLLAVCVVGQRGYGDEQVRWAADAWGIIQAAGATLAWGRLTALAAALRVGPPVAAALAALQAELNVPIPAEALGALRAEPPGTREARFWALNARPRGRLGEMPVLWADYLRRAELGWAPGGWLRFWQAASNLPHVWQLPGHAARRLWRRAG